MSGYCEMLGVKVQAWQVGWAAAVADSQRIVLLVHDLLCFVASSMTRVLSCTLIYSCAHGHWHTVRFVLQSGNELETPASSSSGDTECKQFSRDLLKKHEAAVI